MDSRIKLREKLLSKEKREQITKLEVLKKHVDQAKDRMIVVNTSGQLKREAIESEHDYLVANLELVKAKKRLIDIETEMRELRLFEEKYNGEQQEPQEVGEPKEMPRPMEIERSTEVARPTEVVRPAEVVRPTEVPRPTEVAKPTKLAKPTKIARPTEVVRPMEPPFKRRPSKEVMMCSDIVSPEVDPETFNSPGDPPPPRKVMDNVKVRSHDLMVLCTHSLPDKV